MLSVSVPGASAQSFLTESCYLGDMMRIAANSNTRSTEKTAAWDSPRLLTVEDLDLASRTVEALEAFDFEAFEQAIEHNLIGFFERVIGRPEGVLVFSIGTRPARRFQFIGLVADVLPGLRAAVQSQTGPIAWTA